MSFEPLLIHRLMLAIRNGERMCVHCGCTDSRACPGGCHWVVEHAATPTGVCSRCVEKEKPLPKKGRPSRAGRK